MNKTNELLASEAPRRSLPPLSMLRAFEAVARNELGERCFASPALSGGRLYLRGDRHLFCIGRPR